MWQEPSLVLATPLLSERIPCVHQSGVCGRGSTTHTTGAREAQVDRSSGSDKDDMCFVSAGIKFAVACHDGGA